MLVQNIIEQGMDEIISLLHHHWYVYQDKTLVIVLVRDLENFSH